MLLMRNLRSFPLDKIKISGGILVVAETIGTSVHRVSYELLGIASMLKKKKHMPVIALAMGPCGLDVEGLRKRGADQVYVMEDQAFAAAEESVFEKNILAFAREEKPEIMLFGATNFGRSLAPRLAAALGTGLTADCTGFDLSEEGRLIQIRPAFSDNIFAHIMTATDPQMATVRFKEFPEAPVSETCERIDLAPVSTTSDGVLSIREEELALQDISEAEVVVAAGRGVKRAEDLKMLEELATLLGGRLGVSRALVDAGMADSSIQIGYSGHRVKAKLYIAAGISGAPQHLAGMKESGTIVAINTDASAPIFRIADIGYVGDLYEIIPKLIEKYGGEAAHER